MQVKEQHYCSRADMKGTVDVYNMRHEWLPPICDMSYWKCLVCCVDVVQRRGRHQINNTTMKPFRLESYYRTQL